MLDKCESCPDLPCRTGLRKSIYCQKDWHKCSDCRFCDAQNLTCYPESNDCLPSYDLDEEDLSKPGPCDFFEPIMRREGKESNGA